MSLTTRGPSIETQAINKKRYEDVQFNFAFAASDSVDWTGTKVTGQLRNFNDVLLWDSGLVNASVAVDGSASASIRIPSATTGTLLEGSYYIDFFFWGDAVTKTATKTYVLKIADGPTNL